MRVSRRIASKAAAIHGRLESVPYTIHFSAEFNRPFSAFGTWRDNRIEAGKVAAANEGQVGAYVTFDTTNHQEVQMKVGISFISPEKARANLLQEISGWDFDAVRRQADASWENALGKIRIEGGTESQRRVFYTAALSLPTCHTISAEGKRLVEFNVNRTTKTSMASGPFRTPFRSSS